MGLLDSAQRNVCPSGRGGLGGGHPSERWPSSRHHGRLTAGLSGRAALYHFLFRVWGFLEGLGISRCTAEIQETALLILQIKYTAH